MALVLDYAQVSTGNPYTTIDGYNSQLANNGAACELGSAYSYPVTAPVSGVLGAGAPLVMRYVRYLSTANPAVVAGPAPVYWTDQTFTTVSGVLSEGFGGANSVAGWLLPNTTSLSTLTAATLNGNFVWIGVSGFIPGCIAPASTAAGDLIIGASGNFTPARVAQGTAPTNRPLALATSAVASGLANMLALIDWTLG